MPLRCRPPCHHQQQRELAWQLHLKELLKATDYAAMDQTPKLWRDQANTIKSLHDKQQKAAELAGTPSTNHDALLTLPAAPNFLHTCTPTPDNLSDTQHPTL